MSVTRKSSLESILRNDQIKEASENKPQEASTNDQGAAPKVYLGNGTPRGYGHRPRLSPEAAAAFAVIVDTARTRAAMDKRTLIYTIRWGDKE